MVQLFVPMVRPLSSVLEWPRILGWLTTVMFHWWRLSSYSITVCFCPTYFTIPDLSSFRIRKLVSKPDLEEVM